MTGITGKVLAVDPGEKRIGLAVSDALGISGNSLGFINGENIETAIENIAVIISEKNVSMVVVGIPVNMNGTIGEKALMAQELAGRLRESLQIPVDTVDERLTTREAERILISGDVSRSRRKKAIDGMSAVLILQKYLDMKR